MTISLITAKELWDRLEQTYECKGIHWRSELLRFSFLWNYKISQVRTKLERNPVSHLIAWANWSPDKGWICCCYNVDWIGQWVWLNDYNNGKFRYKNTGHYIVMCLVECRRCYATES
jgi:hypothetical protein